LLALLPGPDASITLGTMLVFGQDFAHEERYFDVAVVEARPFV
jgi:hypothetical protein